ncbi:chaperone protein DnaJ-like [Ylistrum balloti]|uniref:chaperone protein DnaJ-like n=1 Tax=Ylistrum balloti TaxID=509963 RepID=UPI00290587F8|nr:chaperone protein DnaJ-like [Ylistrum balloti]
MSQKRDYYEVLGISRSASDADIKKAYRKLAIQYHPDKNQGKPEAEEYFKEATEAYEVLSDPEKKKIYDQYGHEGINASFQGASAHDFSSIFREFEDIFSGSSFESIFGGAGGFSSFFSGGRGSSARRETQLDIHFAMEISLEESLDGVERKIAYERYVHCAACGGSGADGKARYTTCSTCRGRGSTQSSLGAFISFSSTCSHCNGEGKILENACKACNGGGVNKKKPTVKVRIPKGIEHNKTLILEDLGHELQRRKGRVLITIHILPHKLYKREHNNLIVQIPLDFITATLGGNIIFESITKEQVSVPISPYTKDQDYIRISRKGVQPESGYTGDLIVIFRLMPLRKLGKQAMQLLLQLKKELQYTATVQPLEFGYDT